MGNNQLSNQYHDDKFLEKTNASLLFNTKNGTPSCDT